MKVTLKHIFHDLFERRKPFPFYFNSIENTNSRTVTRITRVRMVVENAVPIGQFRLGQVRLDQVRYISDVKALAIFSSLPNWFVSVHRFSRLAQKATWLKVAEPKQETRKVNWCLQNHSAERFETFFKSGASARLNDHLDRIIKSSPNY